MKVLKRTLICFVILLFAMSFPSFASDKLEVHFIDVGQADSILIKCGESSMLIDGGDRDSSSLIYTYLKNNKIDYLDYIVCTHDDSDHVGGLSGAISYTKDKIGLVFAPEGKSEKERFQVFTRKLNEIGKKITIPKEGDIYPLGDSNFQILSVGDGTKNNSSITLRLTHGKKSFIFMGDASEDIEKQIIKKGYSIESDVLKVGHHGSNTSTCYQFLREVSPKYAIIEVGRDNPYGHPTDSVLSKLRDAGSTVYRTDNNGDIIFTSDGTTLTVTVEKNSTQEENLISGDKIKSSAKEVVTDQSRNNIVQSGNAQVYVLNTNTKKFHYPNCKSVKAMKDKNKKEVQKSRNDIINDGYVPCKNCNP